MTVYDPNKYDQAPAGELLQAAAHGWVGVDRRLVGSLMDRPDGPAAALAFAGEDREQYPIDIDALLVDLFRHWGTEEAFDFYLDVVRRDPDEVSDEMIHALLPFGERAVEPLLELYEEVEEEQGFDLAYLLAGLRVRDPRVLPLLLDRLEFDAIDGAICLGIYGDPAAAPVLEGLLAEIPEDQPQVRLELEHAIQRVRGEAEPYQPVAAEILPEYPKTEVPQFDVLGAPDRMALLTSPDVETRAAAAHSFFNHELDDPSREALLKSARTDPEGSVRGRAWASLADATAVLPLEGPAGDEEVQRAAKLRSEMIEVVRDTSRDVAERGGAAVGLYGVADEDAAREAIEALYEEGGGARAKALEAMWRSLWKPYAKYFPPNLKDPDRRIVRQALRGAGYFQLTSEIDTIRGYLDPEGEMSDLREDALFAYALAMPGETSRGRVRGMLRKIDESAKLMFDEADLVMFALDERLQLHGHRPVFSEEAEEDNPGGTTFGDDDEIPDDVAEALKSAIVSSVAGGGAGLDAAAQKTNGAPPVAGGAKVGRNDPCPCGSGKKFKKCHGA